VPAAPQLRAKGPPQPKEYSLPNGLRIILVEEHSLPVVSCLVWYRVGARNERPGSTGLAHMVEHLAFDEVGTFRKGELGATIVRNGGQFNGFTSDDFTAFFETLHPAKLDLALKIEAMRMRSARFTKAAVQAEIANLKREFEEERCDAAATLASEVRCVSFLHHPYGSPTRGWLPDVEGLTAEDAKGFYDRFYVPNNATLVVVGDFNSTNALASIKKYFGAFARSATPMPVIRAREPEQRAERRVMMRYPGKTELLQISYHAPSIAEQDSAPMAVLEKLLNASIAGRLKTKLMETKVCSGANSQFELKRDPGLLTITATPAAGQTLSKALDAIDSMISQLRSQAISDAELRRAKNQAEFACFSERDGPYRTGFHIGYFDSISSWKNAYSWPERLRTVSSADILRVAKLYLVPENRVVGFLSSTAQPKATPQLQVPPPSKQTAPKTPQADHIDKTQSHTPISYDISKQILVGYKNDDAASSPEVLRLAQKPAKSAPSKKTETSASKKETGATKKEASASKKETGASEKIETADSRKAEVSAGNKAAASASKKDATVTKSDSTAKKSESAATRGASTTAKKPEATKSAVTGSPGRAPMRTTTTAAPRPPVGSSLHAGHYSRKVLKNGLTVIAFESRLCPIVQITGAIRAGEAYEPTAKPGLAMVLANALNYGTQHATRSQLQAVQEDLGLPPQAMLKFEPGLEQITFQTRCLAKDMVQQLGIVAESIASPALADADMEKAKQDAVNGLRRSDETVAARVNRALMRSLLAPNSPHFPSDPSEKAKVIELLKQSEIKDYYSSTVSPASTMIVLAGDFDGEQAIKSAEAVFENWQSNTRLSAEPDVVPSTRRSLKVSVPTKDRSQTMVCVGKLVKTAPGDRDFCHLAIADCALTNHPIFSRLVQRDTDEAVLATSLSSEEMNSRFQSLGGLTSWSLIVPTEPEAVAKEVNTINTELKAFVQKGMTPNEIQEVKRYLSGVICVRYMPNLSAAAKSVLDAALERAEGDFVGELLMKIANADSDSVNRFIRNVFRPDQATLVVAGDKQAIKQVQPKVDSDSKVRAGATEARAVDKPETVSPQ
jgi:zinc protease